MLINMYSDASKRHTLHRNDQNKQEKKSKKNSTD